MITVFRLVVRSQVTRGRVAGLLAFGAIGMLLAVAARSANPVDRPDVAYRLVFNFGLGLLAPVTALVFASSAFGDLVDDRTLVYLWLRPVARWKLAAATALASWCVAAPFAVGPMVAMAAVAGEGTELVVAAIAAGSVAVAAYGALFVGFGLLVRRALMWGLAYILIWEGFVARSGTGASRFSVLYYARTLLADVADHELPALHTTVPVAVITPLVAALAAVALTSWALHRIDVP